MPSERLQALQGSLNRVRGRREALLAQLRTAKDNRDSQIVRMRNIELGRALVQEVALETQRELEFHVSSVASLALSAVFSDPYQLVVHFTPKRGKSEAVLAFLRDGVEFNPMDATGGGAVDLAAFSLRVSMLTLHRRCRPVLMMDEPFRFLSKDLHNRAGEVIRELSKSLGIQFIIVTHERTIADAADRVFTVTKHNGISQVSVT